MRRRIRSRHTRLEWAVLALALSGVGIAQAGGHKRPMHAQTESFGGDFEPHFFSGQLAPAQRPAFAVPGPGLSEDLASDERSTALSAGSTVLALPQGLVALDRDSGELVLTDREGQILDRLHVGTHPTQMVRVPRSGQLWIADHEGDRIVAVSAGATTLRIEKGLTVHAPWGLAMHPDGRRLYVTSSVEGTVRQIDTRVMKKTWERDIGPEPRAVAVSPDGSRLMIGFLRLGATAELGLDSDPVAVPAEAIYHTLDPAEVQTAQAGFGGEQGLQRRRKSPSRRHRRRSRGASTPVGPDAGRTFARNNFALAFLGPNLAVVPHQLSTPVAAAAAFEDNGGYGGGGSFSMPVHHRMSFIEGEGTQAQVVDATIALHQPRALAYDAVADRLYAVGHGNDQLLMVSEASQTTMHADFSVQLLAAPGSATVGACGPDGVAVAGAEIVVHCSLDRSLRRFSAEKGEFVGSSGELSASTLSDSEQRGAEVFRRGNDPKLSTFGAMACASCHPEGLTDGLSWRIEGRQLQTPLISGRLVGAHPFKWDGQDKDLPSSLRNTVGRLGGSGLSQAEATDLQAFLEGLEKPRAPLARRLDSIERGRALFASADLSCDACHFGERLADGEMHTLDSDLPQVDTPSLVGLSRSAPYYHDGSAPTLRALLLDNASVHGMSGSAELKAAELDDLIAYLESL